MLLIPASMAKQQIILRRFTGQSGGVYPKPTYDDPITVQSVVFQPQTIYTGTNNDRQIVANAVVFLYKNISQPIPKLSKANIGSKITFEGEEYTVQKIVDNRNPFSNELWSYELEVL